MRKIHESERRLHAGDHPIELLAQDFEKNYNMYIYPVHWQFAQMDQHPSDRYSTLGERFFFVVVVVVVVIIIKKNLLLVTSSFH